MRDNIDESLNNILGGKRSNYTLEEIDQAQKLKRKNGGTLLDNLQAITGKGLPSMDELMAQNREINRMCEESGIDLNKTLVANSEKLNSDLDMFSKELQTYSDENKKVVENAPMKVIEGEDALAAFAGINDVVNEKVYGQEDFVKKLVIAFKRPFVLQPEGELPKNSIFILGASHTGKHLALNTLVAEMNKRKLLKKKEFTTMDLSLYPTASEEKLFLQDLYAALESPSDVIVFENIEKCHTSMTTRLADLVAKGKCNLSERYVMNNGQLVNVTNALASNTVGSLSADDKFLVFISSLSIDKLAGIMGAPFINSLGDICKTDSLSEVAQKKVSMREMDELKEIALKQFNFEIEAGEEVVSFAANSYSKQTGLKAVLDLYDDILKALAELKLEGDFIGKTSVALTVEDGKLMATLPEEDKRELLSILPSGYTGEVEVVKKELEGIVGLKEIKEYILSLEEYYSVQKRRKEAGLKAGEVSKHMIFTGNPGTGKTTIARIISRYLKAIGILTGGQLVEVSRADLVGKYVGHTAPLTNQVIQSAIGGVLFIDEAYSLYRGKDDSFGLEAIDTLVKGIEDNRDNLIVILAGYSNEMAQFLTANSGLKSRFPNVINFPDYSGEELLEIAKITAKSKGYTIDEGAETPLLAYLNAVQAVRAKDAGNGRLVRNKVEEAVLNQSKRLAKDPSAELSVLTSEDFDLSDVAGDKTCD